MGSWRAVDLTIRLVYICQKKLHSLDELTQNTKKFNFLPPLSTQKKDREQSPKINVHGDKWCCGKD